MKTHQKQFLFSLMSCMYVLIFCIMTLNLGAQPIIKNIKQNKDKMVALKVKGETYYFNTLVIKEGKTREKLSDDFFIEFIKRRGKIISVKTKTKNGAWTPNAIKSNSGPMKFQCNTTYCICFGDDDCNDMILADVCKTIGDGPIVDGSCEGSIPICGCNRN